MVESTNKQFKQNQGSNERSTLVDVIRTCNREWVRNFDLERLISDSSEGDLDLD